MVAIRPTKETRHKAILDRIKGVPYTRVLEKHRLTPNQFHRAVRDELLGLMQSSTGETKDTLEQVVCNESRKAELFYMDEWFVREQYDMVSEGELLRLYNGTLENPLNVENLIYYAMTSHKPILKQSRKKVIQGLKRLPENLQRYFHRMGLKNIIINGKNDSPQEYLRAFDMAFQRKTGKKSVFDLEQEQHNHEWDYRVPQSYWQKAANLEKAVYHILTEHHSGLKSHDRNIIIETIIALPMDLRVYLYNIGMQSLMENGFQKGEKGSPLAVFKVFDRVYQMKSGDFSLFDKTQTHIEFSGEEKYKLVRLAIKYAA